MANRRRDIGGEGCMGTKQSLSLVLLVSVLALGASSTAAHGVSADEQGKNRNQSGKIKKDKKEDEKHGRASARGDDDDKKLKKQSDIVVIDRDGHLRVVREFYARQGLPPGLAKREALPPGLSKQLRERGRLPPGLQKRLRPVPPELATRLPPVPRFYDRYFADRDLVIVDSRTNQIVSVIRAILP
jgi:hypothetical protein